LPIFRQNIQKYKEAKASQGDSPRMSEGIISCQIIDIDNLLHGKRDASTRQGRA